VEEPHLVAARTVALADTNRGGRPSGWFDLDDEWRQGQVGNVAGVAAVTGAVIGTAGWGVVRSGEACRCHCTVKY
jgi:hypothetical protein